MRSDVYDRERVDGTEASAFSVADLESILRRFEARLIDAAEA
ncbi:MAG TPA: hypothetical protein VFN97_10715 [Actinospica sp.]|nr:hypothetical protein [Actinospica sp.]